MTRLSSQKNNPTKSSLVVFFFALCGTATVAKAPPPPPPSSWQPPPPRVWEPPAWQPPPVTETYIVSPRMPVNVVSVPNVELEIVTQTKGVCPSLVQLMEDEHPDSTARRQLFEGSAPFRWFAEGFKVTYRSPRIVRWRAKLKTPYEGCEAYAIMPTKDGITLTESDQIYFLRMRKGAVEFEINLQNMPERFKIFSADRTKEVAPAWRYGEDWDSLTLPLRASK